jgi:AraC-like DNA-binding protein
LNDLHFGAELLWVANSKIPAYYGTKLHTHADFYHLSYFYSGTSIYVVDGISYTIKPHTCINVPPGIGHCMSTDESKCEIQEIKYTISNIDVFRDMKNCPVVFDGDAFFAKLIDKIVQAGQRRTVPYRHAGSSYLSTLLYYLTDKVQSKESNNDETFLPSASYTTVSQKAIEYIDKNYMYNFTLDALAAAISYHKNYICSQFKRDSGITLSTYMNYVRVFHAAEYIVYGDYTLQQICNAVGFSNVSYFTKTFREIVGVPPGHYRSAFPDDVFLFDDINNIQAGYTLPVWAGRLKKELHIPHTALKTNTEESS